MAVDHNNPQSRDEEILIATIDGTEYNKNPQSRMEELLLELKETIEEGGGGGGTSDYENLSNQPQVNGETLIGDKSGADLGLVDAEEGKGLSTNDYDDTEKAAVAAATSAISAMQDGSDIDSFGDVEVALLDKQDELTAGKYIQITNDEISVKRDIAYEADEVFFAEQTNNGLHVSVTIGSTTLYDENFVTSDPNHTVLDLVQTSFNFRSVRWIVKYLKASKTQSAGYENIVWPSLTDTFVTTVDADKKLIIQSEMDAAINSAVSKCYHHAGTKTCAELLPAILVAANEGNVYEITDSGTTTSDFMEGIGHPIKEGDNVGVARVSDGVYKFDLLSGFVDTTNFVQKSSTAGLIMNDGTIDTVAKQPVTDNNLTTTDKTTTGAINELKSGLTNYQTQNDLNLEVPNRKNLFDPNSNLQLGFSNSIGTSGTFTSGSYYAYVVTKRSVPTFTISGVDYTKIEDTSIRVFVSSSYPAVGAAQWRTSNISDLSSKTVTLSENDKYLTFLIKWEDTATQADKESIMVEEGDTATTFAPYIPSVESRIEAVESGVANLNDLIVYVSDSESFGNVAVGETKRTRLTLPAKTGYNLASANGHLNYADSAIVSCQITDNTTLDVYVTNTKSFVLENQTLYYRLIYVKTIA